MSVQKAILTDTTLCTGCEKCVDACKQEKKLGKDIPRRWKRRIDDLSSTRYTTMVRRPGNRFARQQCRHCLEPACVSVCLVGALQKTAEGPVIYDTDRCIGCRYCMMACPYGIPRYDWQATVPYVLKCDMCFDRVTNGGEPACVKACPEKATIFGRRDQLLEEAHRRIAASPGRYQGRVFGETEVGGTSVLYVSDIPLDFLAWKADLGDEPLPNLTLAALTKVPPLLVGVGGLMLGIFWITGRRMKLAAEREAAEREARPAPPAQDDEKKA
jgi:formate dehydrogenase iron-sulfur subunit